MCCVIGALGIKTGEEKQGNKETIIKYTNNACRAAGYIAHVDPPNKYLCTCATSSSRDGSVAKSADDNSRRHSAYLEYAVRNSCADHM